MFSLFKKNLNVVSPIVGKYVPLNEIPDEAFRSGMMGEGLGIEPVEDIITSPIDGEVVMTFPTKHAIGIKRKDGLEILIHVGIDTVILKGQGFKLLINNNQKIKIGQALLEFDRKFIEEQGLNPIVIIVFTNSRYFEVDIKGNDSTITREDIIAYGKKR